jgi:zinc protease
MPSRVRAACLGVVLLAMLVAPVSAQTADEELLPLDSAIRKGTLVNGLTYLVRANGRPADRVSLRLVVKAGSIDEADDQRGLAHMLEHMAFNGTARFKPGELVRYFESVGVRFGPHVNAYTSFDETVYMLDVSTDRNVLARAFQALADFAGGITLDPAEIDRERGVVIEEWRGRLGAGTRMLEPQLRALVGASRYSERLPIGLPDVIKTFPPERLRDFYRDHYRPDRMAVVVVGDLDPDVAERMIREEFGRTPARAVAPRPVYPIPLHEETRYVSVSDPEAQGSSVSVSHKRPMRAVRTVADYRRVVVESLVRQMLNARFAEIARQPGAPFVGAGVSDGTLGRTMETFTVSARVNDGAIPRGLTALGEEIARVQQHGFGEAELDRAKRSLLAAYERAYNERNTSESSGYATELVRHFLADEAVPGIERELELVKRFLPAITTVEAAGLARELLPATNRVVIATAPRKTGLAEVTEAELRTALAAGLTATVTAWRDEIDSRELMARPMSGSIRTRREIAPLGVTVLTLSNDVEVWLKPTDFRSDQIVFTSYARGGLSLAPAEDYFNASLATALVALSGVGGFTPIDLAKLLAGRLGSVSPYISTSSHGISGSSTPRDLEVALQLAYLYFTSPNDDPAAFELLKRRLEQQLSNQAQNPGAVFAERVRRINTIDHYTARSLKVEDLAALDRERMLAFYRERFANAANFTFFFIGAFQVDDVAPLLAAYLGSLPSTGTSDSRLGDMRLQFPPSVVRETVVKGQEPRSQTVVTFFADAGHDELESHRVRAAAAVLEMRLRDLLREQLGGTYSVNVGYSDTQPQPGYGTVSIQFGSAPENAERLVAAVMAEVDRLRRDGPSPADVEAVKEAEKKSLEESFRQNQYWLNSLQTMHLLQRDPLRILARMDRAESLSLENIHAAFRKHFPADRYTVVTLMPEKQTAAAP